jgi:hypothetical protein
LEYPAVGALEGEIDRLERNVTSGEQINYRRQSRGPTPKGATRAYAGSDRSSIDAMCGSSK